MIGLSYYYYLCNYYDLPTQLCSTIAYITRRTIKIIKYTCIYSRSHLLETLLDQGKMCQITVDF